MQLIIGMRLNIGYEKFISFAHINKSNLKYMKNQRSSYELVVIQKRTLLVNSWVIGLNVLAVILLNFRRNNYQLKTHP